MIAKRVAALVVTVGLIAGALLVRQAIDGPDDGRPTASTPVELLCATELAAVCRSIDIPGLAVRSEEAGLTLDRLAGSDQGTGGPTLWLTFDPFPALVDVSRIGPGRAPLLLDTQPLGSSPIALVTPADDGIDLAAECGEPVSWRCLGDSELAVGFARSTDSGTGLLGVVQAAIGYAAAGGVPLDDAPFQRWLRTLVTTVSASQLSGGTAIATIQTRASSMDVAVGAQAELGAAQRSSYSVQYADPMIRADVVLATSPGASVPGGLVDAVSAALIAAGWGEPVAASNPLPDPGTVTAIRSLWKELA